MSVVVARMVLVTAFVIAGCSSGSGIQPSPSQSPGSATPVPSSAQPTPTPIAATVASPAEAAALVIATDPRFAGAVNLTPDLIGASKWWEAEALAGGAYKVRLTVGWGDCPAGCINRHVWTYEVTADGAVTLLEESGDAITDGSLDE